MNNLRKKINVQWYRRNYFMKFPLPILKILKKIFPNRIWQQIFLLLVFLAVIPLVILGTLLIRTSQNSIKSTILRDYKQVVTNAAGKVKEEVEGARHAMHITASILGTLHADAWRQETAIVELSLRYPVFRRIASVNLKGVEIATSELGTSLKSRISEEAFQQAKSGKSYISDVSIAEDHVPVVTIALPIKQLDHVKNVLIAEISLRGVWDIIDSLQFGKTGKAFLVDQKARIIAHPNKKLILKGVLPKHANNIKSVLSGYTESIETTGGNGKPSCLIASAPVGSLHWGLILEQSVSEAYASSRIMKMQSWIIIVISIAAAMFISFILAKFMSRPMKKLIEGTNRLVQGNFNHSFRIQRRDEVGRLLFSFNQMARKLQKARSTEKLSILGKAATTIAHELKNSLSLVHTFVQLLPKRYKDKKFINEFSKTIPRELDSWNRMLKNMMDFSRLQKLSMEHLDINILLKDILSLAKFRVSQKKIHFNVNLQNNLPKILGNADKLKQVFLNLITNSIEATPKGGTITIEASLIDFSRSCPSTYVEIKISNSGKKILISDLNRIFEPFYTTKDQGLGLGLSISKEIVAQHGGRIEATSEENDKTSFSVQLPVNPNNAVHYNISS